MAGTLRLSNTGTGNGQSTITTAASGDTTYTLPSGGGTFVTTSSTQALTVPFASGTVSAPSVTFLGDSNTGIYSPAADTIAFTEGGVESLRIDSSGRVGIGTTSPLAPLHINSAGADNIAVRMSNSLNTCVVGPIADGTLNVFSNSALPIVFSTSAIERARIDSSGRLLVGTSTSITSAGTSGGGAGSTPALQVVHPYQNINLAGISLSRFQASNPYGAVFTIQKSKNDTIGSHAVVASGDELGVISFDGSNGTAFNTAATISAVVDGTPGANDMPGRLVFSTTADGASSPTERMRIDKDGNAVFKTDNFSRTRFDNISGNVYGILLGASTSGIIQAAKNDGPVISLNRTNSDGSVVDIIQDGTVEGTISVSGTTVSYNGAHLSRWSQLPGGTERTEIMRGTVLSNIDEMCEWGEENNEQLNRMKVSDVEGDPNVSGVFQVWDDDGDTYTDDFYCAMTGDFIIRIAEGVTVQRGQLLMSAGDGTAKPQGDGFVQDKTIAKVTSTHVTCTYDDGSYCVPCVLMAC
jgi:hypothetical protein